MSLPDVKIVKLPGLGRKQPSEDNISGLIAGGIATIATTTTAAYALGTVITLNSPRDAEGYGINADYDTTNKILVYHHISRFFKRNPDATLYMMLVAQTMNMATMCDKTNADGLVKLLRSPIPNGKIRQAGVVLNPDMSTYTPTLTNGLDADVIAAITEAQGLADEEFAKHRPVDIMIEGRQFNGTVANAKDLRTLASPQVTCVIAADNDISTITISAAQPFLHYAAVGDALGCVSFAKVNENIGWVDKFPLTDLTDNTMINAGLSSGTHISNYQDDEGVLHDKGYIFAKYHTGATSAYWNSDPTCTVITDDEAYLENSRTMNKAARLVRQALLGSLNSPVPLTEAGTMEPAIIGSLEQKGEVVLDDNMRKNGEISQFSVFIDPTHNFIQDGEQFDVIFKIVPVGVARGITGKISLVAKLT